MKINSKLLALYMYIYIYKENPIYAINVFREQKSRNICDV